MTITIIRDKSETFPCTWLVERHPHYRGCPARDAGEDCGTCEDAYVTTADCGAPSYILRDQATGAEVGWECEDGHQHITAQVRFEQGWEYAEDPEEAGRLARAGVVPVPMAYAADTSDMGEPPF